MKSPRSLPSPLAGQDHRCSGGRTDPGLHPRLPAALLFAIVSMAGCNLFGGESLEAAAARREADGKAVGGACRHAGRAIEDCYTLNRRADKAAVYAGWREMNDYMRENKVEPVVPQLGTETLAQAGEDGKKSARGASGEVAVERSTEKSADKPAEKSDEKPRAKSRKHDS